MFRCVSKHPPPFCCSSLRQPANFLRNFHQGHPLQKRLPKPKDNDPITNKIYDEFGGKKAQSLKRGDAYRVNIVSSELCEHVIERLAPSLEKHKGCDIIDINPGSCVWSSKLHDHLKPRTHLLVEPDIVYEHFYRPLLEEKDSTYKLIPDHGILWPTLNSLGDHLPHQEPLLPGDPRQNVPNNTLLFTANLGHLVPKIYGFRSLSQLFAYQMMSACRNHAVFQRYGLVRMLLWMDDREKVVLTPRTVSLRTKFSVEAEITFESLVDVASSDTDSSLRMRRREHSVEIAGARKVAEQMRRDGINVPDGRAVSLHLQAIQEQEGLDTDTPASGTVINRPFIAELKALEERFKRGELEATNGRLMLNPEYLRMKTMQHRRNFYMKTDEKLDVQMARYDCLVVKEASLKDLPEEEASIVREEIKKIREEFQADMDKFHFNQQNAFYFRLDDRIVYNRDTPVLLWDRRPYEPLKVRADEFYPYHELALLDMQPKALEPIFRLGNNYDNLEYIISTFFQIPTQSVDTALQSLAPGAFEWIPPECPSLTDASKGGFSDLSMLRVRTLSEEQWKEILTAWMNWPFKPSYAQIISRLGSNPIDQEESIDSEANREF